MAVYLRCNDSYVKYCLVEAQAIPFGFGFSIWCYFRSQAGFPASSHCSASSSYGIRYGTVLSHAVPWASFIDWNMAVLLWPSPLQHTPNIYIDLQDTNMILAYSTKPVRPESMAWWWFRDSSQLPSVTAEGKTIDWHVHRADSQGTAWHQFRDWNFTHCESPAITSLRNFESLPCACVDLGWPIVLPSAVTWLSG